MTYKVFTKEGELAGEANTLDLAMQTAKLLNRFVVIRDADGMEIAGMFGVPSPLEGERGD